MAKRTGVRWLETGILSVMALALVLFCVGAWILLRPYEPLTIYSLQTEPEVCPQENAEVFLDLEWDKKQFASVRVVEIQSSWIAEDVEGITRGTERLLSEVPLSPSQISTDGGIRQSISIHPAPEEPGDWRLKRRTVVRGSPNLEEINTLADNVTTVLPESHARCEGDAR